MAIVTGSVSIAVPEGWTAVSAVPVGAGASNDCIGTHDGTFHCDEALACAMLKMLPEYADWPVVRTRNEEELAKCKVVVDVGAIYDPATLRLDHHQRTFHGTLEEEGFRTRLSSAGIVYKHFGRAVLKRIIAGRVPDDMVDKVLYAKVYKNFMEHIDAIDNGIEVCADGDMPRYSISTHLSGRVAHLNPRWNEADGAAEANARFLRAMALTGGEFAEYVRGLAEGWWPARDMVAAALTKRREAHPSGQARLLISNYCPWKSHLLDLEAEAAAAAAAAKIDSEAPILYVLYADGGGTWRVQAVPESEDSFTSRLPLAAPWRGLRGAPLSAAAGIAGCTFVHASGFIGGNETQDGALAMAAASIAMAESAA
ncbi:unnamed protein product, partial [Phaeothamnion confervicola]